MRTESAVRYQNQMEGSEVGSQTETGMYKIAQLKDPTDALLTRQAAARLLGVTERTIDKWSLAGDFNTYRHRGEVRYLKSEIVGMWKAMEKMVSG